MEYAQITTEGSWESYKEFRWLKVLLPQSTWKCLFALSFLPAWIYWTHNWHSPSCLSNFRSDTLDFIAPSWTENMKGSPSTLAKTDWSQSSEWNGIWGKQILQDQHKKCLSWRKTDTPVLPAEKKLALDHKASAFYSQTESAWDSLKQYKNNLKTLCPGT